MPFTELKELITIITNKNIPDAAALGMSRLDKKDARYKLFDGIRTERFASHEDAAREIYQGSPKDNNFKLLKSRLKRQLMNALIEYDPSRDKGLSPQQRAVYDAVRGVYEVRLLMNNGALHVSRDLAERLFAVAVRHDVTEPAMQLARMLRSLFVYIGDRRKAEEYAELHRRYYLRFGAEDRSEELVDTIALMFSGTTDDLHDRRTELETIRKEMAQLYREHPTFLVTTNFFRVQCLTAHIRKQHLQAAHYGLDAISYLEAHPEFVSRNRIAEFATMVMNEYCTIGDFNEAEKLAERCFENYVPLSNQWYNFLSLYYILTMHSGDYKKAMSMVKKAAVSALSVQPKSNQERWKMYAGYLLYLHEAGFVKFSKSEVELLSKTFVRQKFSFVFNYDLEVYAKDKTGMRIAVLILELLYTIEEGKLDDILALQEKLRLIYYRVLKPDVYPRANAFFHLIQILMQEEFDTTKAEKRSSDDLSVLRPPSSSSSSKNVKTHSTMEGLEVLRYETLWMMMLERIKELRTGGKLK